MNETATITMFARAATVFAREGYEHEELNGLEATFRSAQRHGSEVTGDQWTAMYKIGDAVGALCHARRYDLPRPDLTAMFEDLRDIPSV
jgi:hypothetical protein